MVQKNYFHILRQVRDVKIQNNYIFIDTEAKEKIIDKSKKQLSFYMGCAIFYIRNLNAKIEKTYFDVIEFWDDVEIFRVNSYLENKEQDIFWYAHNSQFDFQQLKGFSNLFRLGFSLKSFYVKNKVFIMMFEKYDVRFKKTFRLHIWDTHNYTPYALKKIGKTLGLEKLEVNFQIVSDKELEIYCKRDTQIIFEFIRQLLNFLEYYKLSKLKATAGALAFSTFRYKFYNEKKNPIYIHNFNQCIKLERESYRGGITDNFNIGYYDDIFKLDINSMYPKEMRDNKLPVKLIAYLHSSNYKNAKGNTDKKYLLYQKKYDDFCSQFETKAKALMYLYHKLKKNYHIIAKVKIKINKKNAYLLSNYRYETKNSKLRFSYGVFTEVFCTPELNYIEKYGKIIEIYEISIYEKRNIFKEYIDFFYTLRVGFKKECNDIYVEFCKLLMNTLYGKFGQKDFLIDVLKLTSKFVIENQDLIMIMIKKYMKKSDFEINKESIIYLGKILNSYELYIVNGKIFGLMSLEKNSKESFVAISSFITSLSRMKLVEFIQIAKRKNVRYCDTDSLFTNLKGYLNLFIANCMNPKKEYVLGKLKIEGYGKSNFYVPKFYDFYDKLNNDGKLKRKVKGINQDKAKILFENNEKVEYLIEKWVKFKENLKSGFLDKQYIIKDTKTMSKFYDKGKIINNNIVVPYSIQELKELYN